MKDIIRITRTSVCAGDSVTAPNEAYLESEQTLSSLLKEVADYLPRISDMSDLMWLIIDKSTNKTLAFITYDGSNVPIFDIVLDVVPTEIFCRHYYRYEFRGKYSDDLSIMDIKDKMLAKLRFNSARCEQ